jgi:hypothetical protein
MKVFRYTSGEKVKVGDRVREAGRVGFVEEIIQPGSDMSCLKGGVCTMMDWGGTQGNVMWEPPDGEHWDELEFLGRNQ